MSGPLNLLVATFPGLGLPRTLAIQVDPSDTISDAVNLIHQRLPSAAASRLTISALPNYILSPSNTDPISTLAPSSASFLTLRLSTPLCGGKGGFGSQLRAAGGRMSSRKKKRQQQGDAHGSSRNLDGRRLRTVAEAKALAEYLAVRPDMERREREERRRRWEQVVAAAERRQDEIGAGAAKARLSEAWVEAKEEAQERTRDAVIAAIKAGEIKDVLEDSETSDDESCESESSDQREKRDGEEAPKPQPESSEKAGPSRSFYGWEEEELSESDEDDQPKSKGKIRA